MFFGLQDLRYTFCSNFAKAVWYIRLSAELDSEVRPPCLADQPLAILPSLSFYYGFLEQPQESSTPGSVHSTPCSSLQPLRFNCQSECTNRLQCREIRKYTVTMSWVILSPPNKNLDRPRSLGMLLFNIFCVPPWCHFPRVLHSLLSLRKRVYGFPTRFLMSASCRDVVSTSLFVFPRTCIHIMSALF